MQQRRYRPGDVLDDYCPRERRVTDHAIVAMIDDDIKQTRCVVCQAEHDFKDGKAPPRRKKEPAALYTQVLDGLQGPAPSSAGGQVGRLTSQPDVAATSDGVTNERGVDSATVEQRSAATLSSRTDKPSRSVAPENLASDAPEAATRPAINDDGPWRRSLIRAALPRPEGHQPQPTRQMPEFTVRQPGSGRAHHGRPPSNGSTGGPPGPMRFGRSDQGGGERPQSGRRRRRGKRH